MCVSKNILRINEIIYGIVKLQNEEPTIFQSFNNMFVKP